MSKLRAAFDEERAWLRACDDEGAVIDRMAGYRDNMAFARRAGNAQAHAFAEHLVELAEDRLTMLKVGATKAKERPAATTTRVDPPMPPPEPPARPTAEPVRADDSAVVRQLQAALAASQEAERRAARERDAADRRARDASAERNSVVAAQRRARGVSAAEPARPTASSATRLDPPATSPSPPTNARPTGAAKPPTGATPAQRQPPGNTASPLASSPQGGPAQADGRASPPEAPKSQPAQPVVQPTPTAAPKSNALPAAPPAAVPPALTGADLAAFRRGAGLNQAVAAQRLGVTQGTISKAEGNPRTVLGPALQEALRRAAG